ncbi:hypothetical protein [Streptomyces sp. NPDC003015]
MIAEHLNVPFKTVVLGVEVTVKKVDLLPGSEIVAVCTHGRRSAFSAFRCPIRRSGVSSGSRRTGTGDRRGRTGQRLPGGAGR